MYFEKIIEVLQRVKLLVDTVNISPELRTVQSESDGVRAVNGGRTDRDLRNEMDGLHRGTLSASGGGDETVSQVFDSGTFSESVGNELQGLAGRTVRTDDSTTDGLRGSTEIGESESILLGQHSNERSGLSSGDKSIEEKLNNVFSSGETEKTSTETADVFVLDDKERLVQITAEIGEKEKVFINLANAERKDYNLISDVVREIQELKKVQAELKEKIHVMAHAKIKKFLSLQKLKCRIIAIYCTRLRNQKVKNIRLRNRFCRFSSLVLFLLTILIIIFFT